MIGIPGFDSTGLVIGLEESWQSRAYEDCILDMARGGCATGHGHHKPYLVQSEYVARTVDSKKESVPYLILGSTRINLTFYCGVDNIRGLLHWSLAWTNAGEEIYWKRNIKGNDAGIMLTSPVEDELEFVLRFNFKVWNTKAQYQALCRLALIGGNPSLTISKEGKTVLHEIHEGSCGSHTTRMALAKKTLRAGYFWPTFKKDAMDWVRKCEQCQKYVPLIHVLIEPFKLLSTPYPFAKWVMVILGQEDPRLVYRPKHPVAIHFGVKGVNWLRNTQRK
ncbi:UNVERIFIED_CONTAM: hypothetical protein Scaly_3044200 [Sesamum calycinum]|uniref:Integrase zinc-binding domain-containing protein n=1 Tax=Sesamum calycinum TaxID=2727403 RepID=A0AAW2K8I5_9LAMI